MDLDYPKVRALHVCIECRSAKNPGELICFCCHRAQKRLNHPHGGDYDPQLECAFDLIETGQITVSKEGKLLVGG